VEEANEILAPLLGLPALPVLDWPEPSVEDRYFRLHPKTRSVVAWAGGEDFAWVDDEITEADREWVDLHHAGGGSLAAGGLPSRPDRRRSFNPRRMVPRANCLIAATFTLALSSICVP
jgi:hypothetical protein